jgi:hypothetical protein
MRVLSSPAKRVSAVVGVVGVGLLVVSFAGYFASDYETILTIKQHYSWTAEADGATKTSSFITVDAECASPIVTVDYERWKKAHANEVAIMAPFPPMGAPWLNPRGHGVIEAEPNNGWSDLGLFGLDEEALSQIRSSCLRSAPIYAHPDSIETRSDLGRWINNGHPRPVIGFGLLGIGAVGMSGLLEACILWFARGEFRRPRD